MFHLNWNMAFFTQGLGWAMMEMMTTYPVKLPWFNKVFLFKYDFKKITLTTAQNGKITAFSIYH